MAAKRKAGIGGARRGAGRPALMGKPVVFSVTIDRSDYDALAAIAEEQGASLASVVRAALGSYARRKRR